MCNASTQTGVSSLEILNHVKNNKPTNIKFKQSSIRAQSGSVRKQRTISKPPKTYRVFAAPITKNGIANSTWVRPSVDVNENIIPIQNDRAKKMEIVRPEPPSYKKNILDDDLNVPVMRNEPQNTHGEDFENPLGTIMEHPNEVTPPPIEIAAANLCRFNNNGKHSIENCLNIFKPNLNVGQTIDLNSDKSDNKLDKTRKIMLNNIEIESEAGAALSKSIRQGTINLNLSYDDGKGNNKKWNNNEDKVVIIKAYTVNIHIHNQCNSKH